jgi:hypothetical protein
MHHGTMMSSACTCTVSNLEVSAPKWQACAAEWRTRQEAETLTPADALQITHDSCVNGIGRRDSPPAATLDNTNHTTVCNGHASSFEAAPPPTSASHDSWSQTPSIITRVDDLIASQTNEQHPTESPTTATQPHTAVVLVGCHCMRAA